MSAFKNIPKVDKVLKLQNVKKILEIHPRTLVLKAIRDVLASYRLEIASEKREVSKVSVLNEERLAKEIAAECLKLSSPKLKRTINGTGVVLHTNLGRSPLSESIRESLNDIVFCYSNLEFDLESGGRGTRYSLVESLLCELTGAEAALVVNNNAAAVMLALTSIAQGKDVIVSRGELVEIGGSFRIPEVMRLSGAILREVGTTNRTHAKDYRAMVGVDTGLFLKVHTSNFAMIGFTAEVTAMELAEIGKECNVPVMADIGSGCLIDLARYGLTSESTVQEYVKAGIDVVTFSGDKLLGGPQAGIIVGKRNVIDQMKKHQLLRALRVDKMTLAALEGTLRLYRDEREALAKIPTLRMLTATFEELMTRGKQILTNMKQELPQSIQLKLEKGFSQVGGGALPLLEIPTALIVVTITGLSAQKLEPFLRRQQVPIVGRINKGCLCLDLRTILEEDIHCITASLRQALALPLSCSKE